MIVPFAPGGASDFAARLLQPKLSELLGQQVVIENREGASGNIGMDLASRAKPDGYTLFFGNVGTVSVNPYVFSSLRVKPDQDFVPISVVADAPGVLVANPEFPPNTVAELVEYAKANPGQVNFASAGAASINRLEMESFRNQAGLDMVHVPYKGGAGPAIIDIVGGHVPIMFVPVPAAMQLIKGGKLKPIAVASARRLSTLPEVPTLVESGYPQVVGGSWQAIMFPKSTPAPVIARWHAALLKVLARDDVRQELLQGGVETATSASPKELGDFIHEEARRWGAVAKVSNATPD
jgi:tripartite-type tricarboxylate transporter receptor subunit TctC